MSTDDVVEIGPGAGRPRAHRRTAAIAVVVLGLVALGGGLTWVATRGGGAGAAGASLACPVTMTNSLAPDQSGGNGGNAALVPAAPTASGAEGRLVPAGLPEAVVLCAYGADPEVSPVTVAGPAEPTPAANDVGTASPPPVPGIAPDVGVPAQPSELPLGRTAEHHGSDAAVAELVGALQGATVMTGDACGGWYAYAATPAQYLIGLTYDDGVVWVAGPDSCRRSTNGVTTSSLDPGAAFAAAMSATSADGGPGTVPPVAASVVPPSVPVTGDPGVGTGSGSSGDPGSGPALPPEAPDPPDPFVSCTADSAAGDALVPFAPISVRVCPGTAVFPDPADAPAATDHPAGVAVELADALGALPESPPDQACTAIGGQTWRLLFAAADGTQAQVDVDAGGCGTATNGVLTVQADDALFARLTALD